MRKINDNCHPGPAMCPFWAHICVEPNLLNSAQVKMGASTLCTANHCTGYDRQLLEFLGHVRSCVYISIYLILDLLFFSNISQLSQHSERTRNYQGLVFNCKNLLLHNIYCSRMAASYFACIMLLIFFFFFPWITYLRIRSEGHFYIIGNGSLVNSD